MQQCISVDFYRTSGLIDKQTKKGHIAFDKYKKENLKNECILGSKNILGRTARTH